MANTQDLLFHGAASEIITPFMSDNTIDFALLKDEVEFLIDGGITGLFVNGLASEALMMNTDERIEAVSEVVGATKGRIPVMANVIYNSIEMAAEYIRGIEKAGADAIIITPPLVYKYTDEALYSYFSGVARLTKLPAYLYNAPETGNKIPPQVIAKLFADVETFQGYKDSTQDIIHQQTVLRLIGNERHFELMAGSDAQIVTTMMLGGVGILSLISCAFPSIIVDIVAAANKEDWKEAIRIQHKILRVREALKIGPFMSAYKYVGSLTGSPLGKMKYPLSEVNNAEKEKIVEILKEQCLL